MLILLPACGAKETAVRPGRVRMKRQGQDTSVMELVDHSGLAPEDFTTLAHFSISPVMCFPKSPGEVTNTVPPKSAILAFNLGSARLALISLLSFSTISAGVFLGATTPHQPLASKPGTKSAAVGIFGMASARVTVVTASARSLPARMYSMDGDMVANTTCTCPPSRSVSAGPSPR